MTISYTLTLAPTILCLSYFHLKIEKTNINTMQIMVNVVLASCDSKEEKRQICGRSGELNNKSCISSGI